ncbi:MAG: prohibitin family protein [Candidatus Bathyarchaeia archaeon]|jgi:regulator of protease activity HflC (stomatin/prohibitin superfamily)
MYEQPRINVQPRIRFPNLKKIIAIIIIVLIVVTVPIAAMRTVPAGYKGILLNWGEAVSVENEGLRWVVPIAQDITLVNIQIQKAVATESTASSDLQEVTTTVAVNYRLQSDSVLTIYRDLRNDYETRVITPNIQEALKAATAKYVATELITEREAVKETFFNILKSKLSGYGIDVLSVSVTEFKFSPSFTQAIENKVTAEQNALAAKNKLQQIQYEAQQQVIQAEANATAIVTLANANANATVISAQGTAEAVQIVQEQLTPEYIQYLYAIGWDGQLPLYWVSGENGTAPYLLVQLPTNSTTEP